MAKSNQTTMSSINKTFFVVIILCLTVIYTRHLYHSNLKSSQIYRKLLAATSENACSKTKYILYWNTAWGSLNFRLGKGGHESFKKCKFKNCFTTYDKNILPVEKYDGILFHIPTHVIEETVPEKRSAHQRYVFANREAPVRFNKNNKNAQYVFNNFFNWTMTYRSDSDIPRPHGYFLKRNNKNRYKMPPRDFVKGKTRSVAWFVSNCNETTSRRDYLAAELAKYIDVDVYGNCGNLSCPRSNSESCHRMLEGKYYFYLAFENSVCAEYITEKMYDILKHNVVPVVYGGANYKELAPAQSVINVENFPDVKTLADYLKSLANNPDEYLKYFEWKKSYYIDTSDERTLCRMCEMLNDPNQTAKSYDNIYEWWFGKNYSYCKTGNNLPEIMFK